MSTSLLLLLTRCRKGPVIALHIIDLNTLSAVGPTDNRCHCFQVLLHPTSRLYNIAASCLVLRLPASLSTLPINWQNSSKNIRPGIVHRTRSQHFNYATQTTVNNSKSQNEFHNYCERPRNITCGTNTTQVQCPTLAGQQTTSTKNRKPGIPKNRSRSRKLQSTSTTPRVALPTTPTHRRDNILFFLTKIS